MNKPVIPAGAARRRRKWSILALLLLGTTLTTVLMVSAAGNRREPESGTVSKPVRKTFVIAHRAGAALAPENTLAALKRSIAVGADMAEVDVQMTKDGVVVVIHDGNLERTAGLNCSVWAADYGVVQELDAGGWYSGEYGQERVPTLEQMAEAARGRIHLMIEVKCDCDSGQELMEKTVKLICAAGMEKECTIACADLPLLQRSKELKPGLDTVFIGEAMPLNPGGLTYVDGYSIHLSGLTGEAVVQAKAAGKKVYAWTVNTEQEMGIALDFGVDGLVTDDPELAIHLIREEGSERAMG
ncbi:MAG: glycerophosphodiester phosphodiesterase family protein [Lawsonibacter sp.]|nr:glycerophosphodiester phosphodiesterase family protein [Lawsonibacter sp.]